MERIAFHKQEIEQAIKFMYWQGTFSKKKHDKLKVLLMDKYTVIMHEYDNNVAEAMERDFKALMKRYGIDDYTS